MKPAQALLVIVVLLACVAMAGRLMTAMAYRAMACVDVQARVAAGVPADMFGCRGQP